ncbi:MAG: hypothetical protein KAI74_02335 [Kiritimatiellae bacterium]|nr:hypothetical protein [Kiritimatiellia bacterium]
MAATNYHHLTTPREILEYALKMEKQSYEFYEEIENHCSVEFMKEIISELKNEEYTHMHSINAMIARLDAGLHIVKE